MQLQSTPELALHVFHGPFCMRGVLHFLSLGCTESAAKLSYLGLSPSTSDTVCFVGSRPRFLENLVQHNMIELLLLTLLACVLFIAGGYTCVMRMALS